MIRTPEAKKLYSSDGDLNKTPATGEQHLLMRKRKKPNSEVTEAINVLSAELKATLNEWRKDLNDGISKISVNVVTIQNDLSNLTQTTNEIKLDINNIRSEQFVLKQQISDLDSKYNVLAQDVTSLQNSIQVTDDQQRTMNCRVDTLSKNTQNISGLQDTITELVTKIDYMDQNARQCNIEICYIPEKKNEDLLSLIENIGTKINCIIQQQDVISIHRVPHAHRENLNPKNIVVKLSSRILRDNILSAYRLAKGLTTEQLGMSGTSRKILMHEHLTLKNKLLFRECKDAAKKQNYKYVWVKHGTILVREKETAKAFPIRLPQDIAKIKPAHVSTQP